MLHNRGIRRIEEAETHFGELPVTPVLSIAVNAEEMDCSKGLVTFGPHSFNPANRTKPERVIIDIDPAYPEILVRFIDI